MKAFELKPDSNVVGASTTVLINWTLGYKMLAGGEFEIDFPIWN